MDICYSTGKKPFQRMNTEELREEFLIRNSFKDEQGWIKTEDFR